MAHPIYILACLIVPAVWGLIVAQLYNRLADRRKDAHPHSEETAEMYHI